MDTPFLHRLKSIADLGRARGVTIDIGEYADAVLHFRPTRRLPTDTVGRTSVRGRRAVIQQDLLNALTHAARIYRTVIHIKVDTTDALSDLLRKSRFTNNMLCEMSDGSRIEMDRGRLFTYNGTQHGL